MHAGAVLTRENRIISIGYNGSPSNTGHCLDHFQTEWDAKLKDYLPFEEWIATPEFKEEHHKWSVYNEVHAEQNAILFAAKSGISTNNSVMYITYSPCTDCAKAISQAGIIGIKYHQLYDREDCSGLDFLKKLGVKCEQVSL
jgi:dCMP deaminase